MMEATKTSGLAIPGLPGGPVARMASWWTTSASAINMFKLTRLVHVAALLDLCGAGKARTPPGAEACFKTGRWSSAEWSARSCSGRHAVGPRHMCSRGSCCETYLHDMLERKRIYCRYEYVAFNDIVIGTQRDKKNADLTQNPNICTFLGKAPIEDASFLDHYCYAPQKLIVFGPGAAPRAQIR